jgi:Sulfotransferase family
LNGTRDETPTSVEDKSLSANGLSATITGGLAHASRKFWGQLSGKGQSSLSPRWGEAPEALLQRARAFFREVETNDSRSLAASKIDDIRYFDVAGMQRVVAVCRWGSSGSLLLHSYLDGHDEVVTLPGHLSQGIYPFFDSHRSLSLRDKLLAYPFASIDGFDHYRAFFEDEHELGIAAADYYAAVNALFEVYRHRPREFLESRRAFFQLLHVVYCVALGRRPASANPLIVYAQAMANDQLASYLVEDFPQAQFIHTVRDPITNVGRLFEHDLQPHGLLAAMYVIARLSFWDKPHTGMEARTMAVRFEDLHLHLEETMQTVAAWLGLPYRSSLLDSTFNGRKYVWITRTGKESWSGARPAKAARDSRNLFATDRCLLYAVLHEDFVAWNYPCPGIFRHGLVRALTCLLLLAVPMKIEVISARMAFRLLPSKDFRRGIKGLAQVCVGRVAIMVLLAVELYRRLLFGKRLLELR